MAMVFQCDVCKFTLDRREVFEVELALGSVLLGENMETRFVQSKQPDDYLLCSHCATYFDRCVQAIRHDLEPARTPAGGHS